MDKNGVVTIWAKHTLSEEEKRSSSMTLANKQIEKDRFIDEKKCFNSTIKGKIDRCASEIGALSASISSGYEFQNMRCTVKLFPKIKTKKFISVDTGQVVEEQPMAPEDFQETLDI